MNQKPGKGNFRELKSKKIPLEACSLGPSFRKWSVFILDPRLHNMNVSLADAISCSLPLTHSFPLLTVNAIVGVLGSPGNFLVCLAIASNSRQHRSSNYLLFSLAITNLIDTLICKPLVSKCLHKLLDEAVVL